MLQIKGLVKRYGDVTALDHLNLEVKEGEIFGVLDIDSPIPNRFHEEDETGLKEIAELIQKRIQVL